MQKGIRMAQGRKLSTARMAVCLILVLPAVFAQTSATITGKVVYTDAQGEIHAVEGARIALTPVDPGPVLELFSRADGAFSATVDLMGLYAVRVSHPNFFDATMDKPLNLAAGTSEISVELMPQNVETFTVDVVADEASDRFRVTQTEYAKPVSGDLADALPVAGGQKDLWNVFKILPGVVAGPAGATTEQNRSILFFNGSRSNQVNWLYNGFRVDDPISADMGMVFGSAQSVDINYTAGRFSVEHGPGTGGTMNIESRTGADVFVKSVSDMAPGISMLKGIAINSWSPRLHVSGPLKKERVRFFNTTSIDYHKSLFAELPRGQDSSQSLLLGDALGVQATVSPQSVLSAGLVANWFSAPRDGLTPLDALSTTIDRVSRRHLGYIRSQTYLKDSYIEWVDAGFSVFNSYAGDMPQGRGILQFFPEGRKGFGFQDIERKGGRKELTASIAFRPLTTLPFNRFTNADLGTHRFKVGFSMSHIRIWQHADRTGYEHYRQNGTLATRTLFTAPRTFSESNVEQGLYLQDTWIIRQWLVLGMGVRWDRDAFLDASAVTPRFSGRVRLPWSEKPDFRDAGYQTHIITGFGWVPEKANLRMLTRPQDQIGVFTLFDPDEITRRGQPMLNVFSVERGNVRMPRATNFSAGVEQGLPHAMFLQVNYLRKRATHGYAFIPGGGMPSDVPSWTALPQNAGVTVYDLRNAKWEAYDSIEFAFTKQLKEKYDWFGSMSWTPKARSNASLDPNADEPVRYTDAGGRMPGDIPKRLVSWGRMEQRIPGLNLKLGKYNAFAYFLEWRDGLPYSVADDEGMQVGEVNGFRFPRMLMLNIWYERKFGAFGYRWMLRAGVQNITNHDNPTLINSNISSANFGTLYGKQPRRPLVSIRFLGKQK